MRQPGGVRTLIEPVFQMRRLRHRVAQLVSGRARIRTQITWVLLAQRGRAWWLDPGSPAWASSLPWVFRMSYLPCVGRCQPSNSPTPGLSFPFDECQGAGFPHPGPGKCSARCLGTSELPGTGAGAVPAPFKGEYTEALCATPSSPTQPSTEGGESRAPSPKAVSPGRW